MASDPTILAAQRVSIGEVQILEWHWPSPLDIVACERHHMIEMSLPPLSTSAVGSFPEVAPNRRARMGQMFIRPAGVAVRSRSSGGHIRITRLAIEPGALEALTGHALPHDEPVLSAGLDLRDPDLRWLMNRLRAELEEPSLGHAPFVDAVATSLAVALMRKLCGLSGVQRPPGRLASWQERRVAARLAEDGPAPAVAELAQLCGVSTRHFARLYAREVGGSARVHVAGVQAERAKRLLGETDLPMKEIAARLGYAHAGTFTAAFRRACGTTPSAWRRQGR